MNMTPLLFALVLAGLYTVFGREVQSTSNTSRMIATSTPVKKRVFKAPIRIEYQKDKLADLILSGLDDGKLTKKLKKITEKLKDRTFTFAEIHDMFLIKAIVQNGNVHTLEALNKRLELLIENTPANPHEFKIAYEQNLEKNLGKKILHNSRFYSIPSMVFTGKMQHMAGTKTYLALRFLSRGEIDFHREYPVVIFQKGHMLPGYIVIDKHKDSHLYGIETTVEGRGVVYFGRAKDLRAKEVRVVDALDYMMIDVFSGFHSSPQELVKFALAKSQDLYGIPFEESIKGPTVSTPGVRDLFAFGNPKFIEEKARIEKDLILETKETYLDPIALGKERIAHLKKEFELKQKIEVKKPAPKKPAPKKPVPKKPAVSKPAPIPQRPKNLGSGPAWYGLRNGKSIWMKKSGMKMELHISPFKQVYRLMYVGNIWKDEYRGCYAQIVPQNGNQEVYKGTMILDISGDCTNRATITAKLRLVK